MYYYTDKLHAACTTLDCNVFTRLLAISWLWPKINALQDTMAQNQYALRHSHTGILLQYVPKMHMATINILDCGVFMRFLGISSGPKSIHFKT